MYLLLIKVEKNQTAFEAYKVHFQTDSDVTDVVISFPSLQKSVSA